MTLLKKLLSLTVIIFGIFAVLITIFNLGFEFYFQDKIYPGVKVSNIDFGGQTIPSLERYFSAPLSLPEFITLTYESPNKTATYSADTSTLELRYDVRLMANRAYSVGRQNGNFHYDFIQKLAALSGNINLPLEVNINLNELARLEDQIAADLEITPIDAQFRFEPNTGPDAKGRVVAFRPSKQGLKLDRNILKQQFKSLVTSPPGLPLTLNIPMIPTFPDITTGRVNRLGIKDLLGKGESYFYDSIPGRIENIRVGTEKISGSLVGPGEEFSFSQAIGTVSAVFGFSKAYVIKDNKTILEDGGGVCQVSTTLYRAILNSGLPVTQREPHSYRVPFYEEGGFKPGMDATVYPPSPDLRFRNDTPNWLLIQAAYEPEKYKLTFDIFGTTDGRKTEIFGPYIVSTSPPPPPIYEDRPDLPGGTLQQIDTAHWGANTYFTRKVVRGEEILIDETVKSDYIPWPARYLRGTKSL